MHAFRGWTVDNVIAVMEAKHPHLTPRKSFYVGSSRARHRAELVTDDAKVLREQLESATGERVSALEGAGAAAEKPIAEEKARGRKDRGNGLETGPASTERTRDKGDDAQPEKVPEQEKSRDPRGIEMGIQFLSCLRLGRLPRAC